MIECSHSQEVVTERKPWRQKAVGMSSSRKSGYSSVDVDRKLGSSIIVSVVGKSKGRFLTMLEFIIELIICIYILRYFISTL